MMWLGIVSPAARTRVAQCPRIVRRFDLPDAKTKKSASRDFTPTTRASRIVAPARISTGPSRNVAEGRVRLFDNRILNGRTPPLQASPERPLSTLSGLSPFASPRPSNGEKFTNASQKGVRRSNPLSSVRRSRSGFLVCRTSRDYNGLRVSERSLFARSERPGMPFSLRPQNSVSQSRRWSAMRNALSNRHSICAAVAPEYNAGFGNLFEARKSYLSKIMATGAAPGKAVTATG